MKVVIYQFHCVRCDRLVTVESDPRGPTLCTFCQRENREEGLSQKQAAERERREAAVDAAWERSQ